MIKKDHIREMEQLKYIIIKKTNSIKELKKRIVELDFNYAIQVQKNSNHDVCINIDDEIC